MPTVNWPRFQAKMECFMNIAEQLSLLSTCSRRRVGCVVLDSNWHILSTGYNGVPKGTEHCTDVACPHADDIHGSACHAIHAEANALMHCRVPLDRVYRIFTTSSPCLECAKLIMNTGCSEIYYDEYYAAHYDEVQRLLGDEIELIAV